MKKHYWNECEIINIFLSKLKFGLLKLLITSMKRLEDFKQKYMEIAFPLIQQQMNIKVENHVLMHHISQNRQRINWSQIDMVLNKKQLSSGVTFSEKYFVDVIKPFFLQKRSEKEYEAIYPKIQKSIVINLEYLKLGESQYKERRQRLLNALYEECGLRDESVFAFKPTQDHLRSYFDRQFESVKRQSNLIAFQPITQTSFTLSGTEKDEQNVLLDMFDEAESE